MIVNLVAHALASCKVPVILGAGVQGNRDGLTLWLLNISFGFDLIATGYETQWLTLTKALV